MFLDDRIDVRIRKDDLKIISKIVRADEGDRYDNESHFIRCAVLKLIREERKRLMLK